MYQIETIFSGLEMEMRKLMREQVSFRILIDVEVALISNIDRMFDVIDFQIYDELEPE